MAMSPAARALHAARLVILSTVIVVALNTSEVDGKNEFHVEKFLRERNEWLADSYSVADEELDKAIAEFALAPDDSTVRDAKTLECKRQIVWTHKRHKAGQNPQHFQNSCPAQKGKGTQAPSRFAVLSVASEVELQRAKKIIEATENKYRRGVQKMRQAYRFMLAVDEEDGTEAGPLMQGAVALTRLLPKTSVIKAKALEADGVPENFGESVRAADVPIKPTDRKIRFAYAIFVSPNDAPWRIYRLLKAIYHEDDFFFLHFDGFRLYSDEHDSAKDEEANSKSFQAVVELCKPFIDKGNVRVEGIFDVSWGGVSMLNAEIAMAQALLEMGEWDYIINLSSTDLPLRTREEMCNLFDGADMYGKNFMWGVRQNHDHQAKRGLRHDFTECESHSFRVNDESMLPIGIELHGGSSWFALHKDFVSWMSDCLSGGFHNMTLGECELPSLLLDYAQNHLSFEELYFHTLIQHSPFCAQVLGTHEAAVRAFIDMLALTLCELPQIPDADLRHIKWEREKGETDGCLHFEEVDWCGNSPRYLTAEEWQQGRDKTPPLLFSRKFRDPDVYDIMDKTLGIDSKEGMPEPLADAMAAARNEAAQRGKVKSNNAAQGKQATSSAFQEPHTSKYGPHNLVDGDLHTRWSSAFSNDHFVMVDLGTDSEPLCDISDLILHWETAYAKRYTVQVSTDMQTWRDVHEREPPAGRSRARFQLKHEIHLGDSGKGIKGIKVVMNERATRWGYSMWELEAVGECQAVEGGGVQGAEIIDDAPVV